MDFKMKCRIGFGFEKPKSVHLSRPPYRNGGQTATRRHVLCSSSSSGDSKLRPAKTLYQQWENSIFTKN